MWNFRYSALTLKEVAFPPIVVSILPPKFTLQQLEDEGKMLNFRLIFLKWSLYYELTPLVSIFKSQFSLIVRTVDRQLKIEWAWFDLGIGIQFSFMILFANLSVSFYNNCYIVNDNFLLSFLILKNVLRLVVSTGTQESGYLLDFYCPGSKIGYEYSWNMTLMASTPSVRCD